MKAATNQSRESQLAADAKLAGTISLESTSEVKSVPDEARASLERLLSSEAMARAPRLRTLLRFLIDALVDGRASAINEQTIGQAVFDRPAGYNPGDDNIVRVSMRHLRERMEEFYRNEGRDEQYVLDIPKGKYVPILKSRQPDNAPLVALIEDPTVASPAEVHTVVPAQAALFSRKLALVLPWALVFLLAVTVAVLAFRDHNQPAAKPTQPQSSILSLLTRNGKQTTVVVTDSNLQAYRMIFRKTVSLDAYIARSYEPSSIASNDPVVTGAWNYVGLSAQTSLTSGIIATEIGVAAAPELIHIKHPHDLSMRDFQHDNFILLGGPWINPWGQLFEERLNFQVLPLKDDPSRSQIHSLNPLPNEKVDYAPHLRSNLTVNYVRVALLRNLSNDGYVILLGATSEEALEAGGKFLVNPQQLEELLKAFNVSDPEKLPSFEVVIEVEGLRSVPENSRIVAERVVKPQ